ncbi:MAG: hypothetical protein HFF26_03295, partial [Oscillospiraceae bacterium]|nr:hypothetical protein [Oscillospiraceae bacterium]
EGWTYLASVMDLCSRKIIGYAYGTSMTAERMLQNLYQIGGDRRQDPPPDPLAPPPGAVQDPF